MREIRIDAEGAGAWIMERVEGMFYDGIDHAFSTHQDGRLLGGFALTGYMGVAMTIHMAACDSRWFSRELAWLVFDYAFNQLKIRKLVAPVRSDNYHSLMLCRRAGWQTEAVLRDLYTDGVHMILLTMTRPQCRWLDYRPRRWRSNAIEAELRPEEAA